jgi:ubiquinone/menaquinone biosynthesis C-methylase UbiE
MRFDDGASYEQMMGRWSALVGAPFLDWLALPAGLDWVDVGCGNGAFTETLVARQQPASVVGVDPSPAQLDYARQRPGTAGVRWLEGDAMALPVADAGADVALMALVLFFVPEPARAVAEMVRAVRPGGTVAAYHWDLDGGGSPMQALLDAAAAEQQPMAQPSSVWAAAQDASERLWREAGLLDVQSTRFDVQRRFEDFDAWWATALVSPRSKALFATLAPEATARIRERARAALGAGDGELVVRANANAVKGRKA